MYQGLITLKRKLLMSYKKPNIITKNYDNTIRSLIVVSFLQGNHGSRSHPNEDIKVFKKAPSK